MNGPQWVGCFCVACVCVCLAVFLRLWSGPQQRKHSHELHLLLFPLSRCQFVHKSSGSQLPSVRVLVSSTCRLARRPPDTKRRHLSVVRALMLHFPVLPTHESVITKTVSTCSHTPQQDMVIPRATPRTSVLFPSGGLFTTEAWVRKLPIISPQ